MLAIGWMALTAHSRRVALRPAVRPTCGGGSLEQAVIDAPGLGFLWGFSYNIRVTQGAHFPHLRAEWAGVDSRR
jgi:hypothetical protein